MICIYTCVVTSYRISFEGVGLKSYTEALERVVLPGNFKSREFIFTFGRRDHSSIELLEGTHR